jgi:predicted Rossmann-fold nucleotide-binding protein
VSCESRANPRRTPRIKTILTVAATIEEFFEIWTWAQLGIHTKPYGLLNVSGYFDPLLAFLEHAVSEKFILDRHRQMVLVEANVETLLERLMAYRAPDVPKWLDRGEI